MKQKTQEKRESLQNSIRQMMGHTDLPEDVFVKAIEDALRVIALRHYGPEAKVSIDIQLDDEQIKCHVPKTVVDIMRDFSTEIPIEEAQKIDPDVKVGDSVEVEINPEEFGRIQAQLGRQILLGKLREAEREQVYNEFEGREGEVVVGYLQRYDGPNAIVDLERTDVLRAEALLPGSQIPPTHRYNRGDAIRCLILEIKNSVTGEQIVVSRTHPDLIAMLCEQEIPEVYEGQVRVMAVAREPGYRAKVAVVATEEGIDAVGTCVGVRGNRVRTMVQELKNEKIDFVDWDEDPRTYIANSLKPVDSSKVKRVELNEEDMSAIVVVPDDDLSLAIGRRGTNARLVAKLTGWKIDIKSESQAPYPTLENIFKDDSNDTEEHNEDPTEEGTTEIEEKDLTESDTDIETDSEQSDESEDN